MKENTFWDDIISNTEQDGAEASESPQDGVHTGDLPSIPTPSDSEDTSDIAQSNCPPTVAWTTLGTQRGRFTIRGRWSRRVYGFTNGDISISQGSKVRNSFSYNPCTRWFSLRVDPPCSGSGTIQISIGARDVWPYAPSPQSTNVPYANYSSVSWYPPRSTQTGSFLVLGIWNQSVSGFNFSDITVRSTSGTARKSNFRSCGNAFSFRITPPTSGSGTITFSIGRYAISPIAACTQSESVEFENPARIQWTPPAGSIQYDTFIIRGQWNQAVRNFCPDSDISISAGTKGRSSYNSNTRRFWMQITPPTSGSGIINISICPTAVSPSASGCLLVAVSYAQYSSVIWTRITSTQTNPFRVNGRWNQNVGTSFSVNDVSVSRGSINRRSFTYNRYTRRFSFIVNPPTSGCGTLNVSIPANAVSPPARTAQTLAVGYGQSDSYVTWDAPTTVQNGSFTVSGTWNQDVSGLQSSEIVLNTGTKGTVTQCGRTFSFVVTPPATGAGTIIITIARTAISPNAACDQTTSVQYERLATVCWNVPATTQYTGFNISGTWDQRVFFFNSSMIHVSTGTISNRRYNARTRTFSAYVQPPSSGSGSIVISICPGNTILIPRPSGTQSATVSYQTPSRVDWDEISGVKRGTFAVGGTWNQIVSGFSSSKIDLSVGTLSNFSFPRNSRRFTFDVTPPSGSGSLTISICRSGICPTVQCPQSIVAEYAPRICPSEVTWTYPRGGTQYDTFTIYGVWNQDVSGFNISDDVNISHGTLDSSNVCGRSFNLTITPPTSGSGVITISICANAITPNAQSTQGAFVPYAQYSYVTWLQRPVTVQVQRFFVSGRWNQVVSQFNSCDVNLNVGTLSNFQLSDRTFSFWVTPPTSGTGNINITICAGSISPPAERAQSVSVPYAQPSSIVWEDPGTPTGPFTLRGRWNQVVEYFENNDITISVGTKGTFSYPDPSTGKFSLVITPPEGSDGNISVSVCPTGISPPAAEPITLTIPYKRRLSKVIWETICGIQREAFTVRGTWNQVVEGFTAGDINVSPGTKGRFNYPCASDKKFSQVVIPPTTGDGTTIISICANAITPPADGTQSTSVQYGQYSRVTRWTTPTGIQVKLFSVSGVWNQTVTDFVLADIQVSVGQTSNFCSDGRNFSFDVTPPSSGSGTVGISICPTAIDPPASCAQSVSVSYAQPSEIFWLIPSEPVLQDFSVVGVWNQSVGDSFDANDVMVDGACKGRFVYCPNSNSFQQFISHPATGTGTITISVAPTAITPNALTTLSEEIDYAQPSSVTWTIPSGRQIRAFSVSGRWNQVVRNFAESDISLTAGILSNFCYTEGSLDFSFTVTPPPTGSGTIIASICGNAISPNALSTIMSCPISYGQPSRIIEWITPDTAQTGPFTVSGKWNQVVTDFQSSDITVSTGSFSNFVYCVGGVDFSILVTPPTTETGTLTISICPTGIIPNALETQSVIVPYAPPPAVEPPPTVRWTIPCGTVNQQFTVYGVWSRSVTGFQQSDVSVSPGTLNTFNYCPTTNDRAFSLVITPPTTGSGDITISICAGAVTPNADGPQSVTVPYEQPSSVQWTVPTSPAQQIETFPVRGIWNQVVEGFQQTDVSLSAGVLGCWSYCQTSRTFNFNVTPPTTGSGTILISINANAITPRALQDQSESVAYAQPSAVTFNYRDAQHIRPFNVNGLWNQLVEDFAQSDVALSAGTITNFVYDATLGQFSILITPPSSGAGTLTLSICPTSIRPNAIATISESFRYAQPSEVTSWTPGSTTTQQAEFALIGVWNQEVSGMTSADINISAGCKGTFSYCNRTFTQRIVPPSDGSGTISISINSDAITPNALTTQTHSIPYGPASVPRIDWDVPTTIQTGEFNGQGTWSETVDEFVACDLLVSIGSISCFNFNSATRVFTFKVTPPTRGTGIITISVPANSVVPRNALESTTVGYGQPPSAPFVTWDIDCGTKTQAFEVAGTWSQDVMGFEASDVTISIGMKGNDFTYDTETRRFTLTVTPPTSGTGTITISICPSAITPNADSTQSTTVDYAEDTLDPGFTPVLATALAADATALPNTADGGTGNPIVRRKSFIVPIHWIEADAQTQAATEFNASDIGLCISIADSDATVALGSVTRVGTTAVWHALINVTRNGDDGGLGTITVSVNHGALPSTATRNASQSANRIYTFRLQDAGPTASIGVAQNADGTLAELPLKGPPWTYRVPAIFTENAPLFAVDDISLQRPRGGNVFDTLSGNTISVERITSGCDYTEWFINFGRTRRQYDGELIIKIAEGVILETDFFEQSQEASRSYAYAPFVPEIWIWDLPAQPVTTLTTNVIVNWSRRLRLETFTPHDIRVVDSNGNSVAGASIGEISEGRINYMHPVANIRVNQYHVPVRLPPNVSGQIRLVVAAYSAQVLRGNTDSHRWALGPSDRFYGYVNRYNAVGMQSRFSPLFSIATRDAGSHVKIIPLTQKIDKAEESPAFVVEFDDDVELPDGGALEDNVADWLRFAGEQLPDASVRVRAMDARTIRAQNPPCTRRRFAYGATFTLRVEVRPKLDTDLTTADFRAEHGTITSVSIIGVGRIYDVVITFPTTGQDPTVVYAVATNIDGIDTDVELMRCLYGPAN